MPKQKNLTLAQQLKAIGAVALMSFKIAPGAVIFKLLGSVINAVLPIVTTYFAARTTTALVSAYGGNQAAKSQVIILILLTAAFGLIMTIWSTLDNYVQIKMRYVVETRVSTRMFDHFLSLDFWRYDDKDTADLYDRAQKFSSFFAWIFDRIATIISQLISIIASIVALVAVSWAIALLVLVAVIPGIYVQFKLSRKQIKQWNKNVEVRRKLNLIEWDMLQPKLISELRLYGMVNYLLRLRTELRDKDEKHRIEIKRETMPLILLSNVIEALAEIIALVYIGLKIVAQKQPIGQFVFVQQLVSRAISSSTSLVSTISSIEEDIANLIDYEQFMKLPAYNNGSKQLHEPPQEIIFEDVSFHYPGKKTPDVLRNITFSIKRNQNIAIVGENGAGKSTLIKLLTGLYHPTNGQILIDGVTLQDLDIKTWHQQLGVLQQEFITYGFATAKDNVRYGNVEKRYNEDQLVTALKDAEAMDFTAKLPKGLDNFVNNWMQDDEGNKGTGLSGGQWQRIALARNFYRNAPIIILDEPTSAIDALAEDRIFTRLFQNRKRTVITISHRLSTIKKADVIYVLKDGEITETGTHDELIRMKGYFYKMFKSQLR
jgi:ATP-binding cassette subfamily B protein/ATP-binding cassette subfamily C protein